MNLQRVVLIGILVLTSPCPVRAQAELRLITVPSNPLTQFFGALGISAPSEDGRVVGGSLPSPAGIEAVIWKRDQGLEPLPLNPDLKQFGASANAISPDGNFAAGFYEGILQSSGEARSPGFRWQDGLGLESIAASSTSRLNPRAISAGGHVIAGSIDSSGTNMFRWTASKGLEVFPDFDFSSALDISADGKTIVGVSDDPAEAERAFRWTELGGFQTLVDVAPDLTDASRALRWVEGRAIGMVGTHPFVWSGDQVDKTDADLPGVVHGMSADFSQSAPKLTAILTMTEAGQPDQGMIWTSDGGLRSVESFLKTELGLANEVAGWTNFGAHTISKNGLHIVGSATTANGAITTWIVSVPEPSAFGLATVGICGLLGGGLRRSVRKCFGTGASRLRAVEPG
ncbi:MAG: hypothetical protein U0836_22490 [Pirellulales bacterium]